ncbi:MAG TPA: hypothetical protein VNS58_30825, partial [Puia sp.]|nr:hypothetical protein [Puia sp.]
MKQRIVTSKKLLFKASYLLLGLCMTGLIACAGGDNKTPASSGPGPAAPAADTSIKFPEGFSAVTVVDAFGKTRHIAVTPGGVVFVKLAKLKDGKGIYRLQDTNGDGKADKVFGFGNFPGTGIAVKNGYLYASSDEEVFRFKLDANDNVVNPDKPERI